MSSPNRPNDSRTSSTLPRGPHLRDDSVIALACKRSPAATRTPDRCGTGVPPGNASATSAVDATWIRRAAAAVRGATPSDEVASRGAGTASTTASACQCAALVVDAVASRCPAAPAGRRPPAPSGSRRAGSARRAAPRSRRRSRRTPTRRLAAAARWRTASVRLRAPRSSTAASVGAADRSPIVAADPAYTPASSGSTERVTTWSPNRSPTSSATEGSAPGRQVSGRRRLVAHPLRSWRRRPGRPATPRRDGMPLRVSRGSGACRPWL